MSQPQPPKPPQTAFGKAMTQATQVMNNLLVRLKPNVKVPELIIKLEKKPPETRRLPGDRYILGRKITDVDIPIQSNIASSIHCSITRNKKNHRNFILKDNKSTNGTFIGKTRLKQQEWILRHGDIFTIASPDLADSVEVTYHNPPSKWILALRYILFGMSGITALTTLFILIEWSKYPLAAKNLVLGVNSPTIIYANDEKTPLSPISKTPHREIDNLADFNYVRYAVIASEDSRFNWHFGFDPYGIARAIVKRVKTKDTQGASTLTQQMARSLFPEVGRENTTGRKIKEIIVATKLEFFYSKDEILKLYLNKVFTGLNHYGFEDAGQFYFEKSVKDLTVGEAATLVGMLPAPNKFNPATDYEASRYYRDRVIERMEKMGFIDRDTMEKALRSRIKVSEKAKQTLSQNLAPYFTTYIYRELEEILGKNVAGYGNWIIVTGLDLRLQKLAQDSLKKQIRARGVDYKYSQGAIITLDSKTGEVVAYVGGVDYKQSQFDRVSQAHRQPGSTFKVFTYGSAIDKGISPYTTYSCAGVSWMGQTFKPCERSSGNIDMFHAIAQSENAVALRIAQATGLDNVIDFAKTLGITSPLTPAPGLVLGQSEVYPLEITGAYTTFANNGYWVKPHGIKKIYDANDCTNPQDINTCRLEYSDAEELSPKQVISETVADTVDRLLQGVVAQGTATQAQLRLPVAGKTGTTNDGVDLWFIGYVRSRNLVTGVWLGNDDSKIPTKSSSKEAVILWKSYMEKAIQ